MNRSSKASNGSYAQASLFPHLLPPSKKKASRYQTVLRRAHGFQTVNINLSNCRIRLHMIISKHLGWKGRPSSSLVLSFYV